MNAHQACSKLIEIMQREAKSGPYTRFLLWLSDDCWVLPGTVALVEDDNGDWWLNADEEYTCVTKIGQQGNHDAISVAYARLSYYIDTSLMKSGEFVDLEELRARVRPDANAEFDSVAPCPRCGNDGAINEWFLGWIHSGVCTIDDCPVRTYDPTWDGTIADNAPPKVGE